MLVPSCSEKAAGAGGPPTSPFFIAGSSPLWGSGHRNSCSETAAGESGLQTSSPFFVAGSSPFWGSGHRPPCGGGTGGRGSSSSSAPGGAGSLRCGGWAGARRAAFSRVSGARREAAPDERRVICEICKVSYGAHHYEQYHKHRCKTETTTESFQAPRSLQEGATSSRWTAILRDYSQVRQLVLGSPRVVVQTTLQLLELNQRTGTQWHNKRPKVQEQAVLLQGLAPPSARTVHPDPQPQPCRCYSRS
ncbi:UNVERIFIED_CONTAM: hypothetical protein FKN15_060841 [Acipenser sinensis]